MSKRGLGREGVNVIIKDMTGIVFELMLRYNYELINRKKERKKKFQL